MKRTHVLMLTVLVGLTVLVMGCHRLSRNRMVSAPAKLCSACSQTSMICNDCQNRMEASAACPKCHEAGKGCERHATCDERTDGFMCAGCAAKAASAGGDK